jgi:hypothetical protein
VRPLGRRPLVHLASLDDLLQNNADLPGSILAICRRPAEFDKMLRLLQKVALSTLPGTTILLPPQFLALLSTLPDDVDAAIKAEKSASKKSSQANAKALNSMKQKVKKAQKEFEDNLNAYKKVRLKQHGRALC